MDVGFAADAPLRMADGFDASARRNARERLLTGYQRIPRNLVTNPTIPETHDKPHLVRGLSLGSATALAQRGIGKTGPNALHAGDNITVKFPPARDGSPLGISQDRDHAGRACDPDLRR